MSLSQLQQRLQGIYELEMEHQVNDFLVTSCAELESEHADYIRARETLLVCQQGDELLLSLYLHEGIINSLQWDEGALHLHAENIEDFCLALEGISHFIYLVWHAGFQRCVTRLEMEIQAEVDKFIVLSNLLQGGEVRPAPGHLRRVLFETARITQRLEDSERVRYREASNFAGKYCRFLEANSFLEQRQKRELLRELRRFYRMDLRAKLRRIDCLH